MTPIQFRSNRSSFQITAICLLFAAVILVIPLSILAVMQWQSAETAMNSLADLPMTGHASQAHNAELWTPFMIQQYMARGGCKPIVYVCKDEIRYFCDDPSLQGNWLGLITGSSRPVVITGYTARASFWLKGVSDDGCTRMAQ